MRPPTRYLRIFSTASARLENVGTNSCPTLSARLIFATWPGIQASGSRLGDVWEEGAPDGADDGRPPLPPPSPAPQPAAVTAARSAAANTSGGETRTRPGLPAWLGSSSASVVATVCGPRRAVEPIFAGGPGAGNRGRRSRLRRERRRARGRGLPPATPSPPPLPRPPGHPGNSPITMDPGSRFVADRVGPIASAPDGHDAVCFGGSAGQGGPGRIRWPGSAAQPGGA